MKYRILELLACPTCHGALRAEAATIEPVVNPEQTVTTYECTTCYRNGVLVDCSEAPE